MKMPLVTDPELVAWNQRRQVLVRLADRHDISDDEYTTEHSEIEEKINQRLREMDEANTALLHKKAEEEARRRATMADEVKAKKVAPAGEKKTRGPRSDSYAALILEALQLKTVKNIDQAADRVLEKKPGRDKAKVKAQIAVMINEVKKGKKPAYAWDAENFQLSQKTA